MQIAGATSTATANIQQPTPTSTVGASPPLKKPKPYPNPFNPNKIPELIISYNFMQGIDRVTVKIYTVSFRLVREYVFDEAEMQQIILQGYVKCDATGLQGLSSGTYFYIIITDNSGKTERSQADKIIILK
jgi:hypothetical protein